MNVDARISVGLPSHPKTKKLIKRGGQAAAWNLVCLLLWVSQNKPDGDLSGMTAEDIEIAAGFEGDEGAFVQMLVDVRFIDGQPGAYAVHDWAEHNPWAAGAEQRSAKARWNATRRHHGEAAADRAVPEYAAVRNAGKQAPATDSTAVETDNDATSTATSNADVDANSNATSTNVVASSNAPFPSPFPSPSPSKRKDSAPSALELLAAEDVPPDLARDFLAVRKAKKAPLTPHAMLGIKREAGKARMRVPDAIRICVERGWQGFNADWLPAGTSINGVSPTTTLLPDDL